jgi:hypothetical protein
MRESFQSRRAAETVWCACLSWSSLLNAAAAAVSLSFT